MSAADAQLDEAVRLIAEIGTCYSRARRYRALAAECEERYLARALAIGSAVRRHARGPNAGADATSAVRELARLLRECAAALDRLRSSDVYRAAVLAWDAGRWRDVAALAPDLFDAVVPDPGRGPLFVPVGVTSGRGGGEHFLAPEVVAERILDLVTHGIPAAQPTPELGADERIGAVFLEDDPDAAGSPVTLVLPAEELALPRFRLDPAGEVLVYTLRLETRPGVRFAATVDDEWWAVRPDAYADYTAQLTRELAVRGVDDVAPA